MKALRDWQPGMVYVQQRAHAVLASGAKFLAVVSVHPTTGYVQEPSEAVAEEW